MAMARAAASATWARITDIGRHESWMRVVVFSIAGATLAVMLFGRVPTKIGPFEATASARPSLTGNTVVRLAPLGTVELDTHDWPLTVQLSVTEISLADAEAIAENPARVEALGNNAADEVRSAAIALVVRSVIVGLLGGVVGSLVARVSWRTALGGAGVGVLLVAALGFGSWATFRADSVTEPRYTGLLTRAPTAVGDLDQVIDRFGQYRAQLGDLVDNMATLYLAGQELPTLETDSELVRILHVSDIHLNPQAFDMIERLVDQFGVDAVADTGDITDWGTRPEAQIVSPIGDLDVTYVYVRGNHDSLATQNAVAFQPNAVVLDGDGATVAGLRFWGIGDPRYTPDKGGDGEGTEQEQALAFAPDVAEDLLADEPPAVDVAMVHDERMAAELGGQVPLVLAGHTHEPADEILEPPDGDEEAEDEGAEDGADDDGDTTDGDTTDEDTTEDDSTDGDGTTSTADDEAPEETRLLVEGSTGGAGLRGLQGEEPEPLTASVLYFDPDTSRLVAYDRLTVAWLGDAGATIERNIIEREDADEDGQDDPDA